MAEDAAEPEPEPEGGEPEPEPAAEDTAEQLQPEPAAQDAWMIAPVDGAQGDAQDAMPNDEERAAQQPGKGAAAHSGTRRPELRGRRPTSRAPRR